MISRHHQAHLNELAGVLGQPAGVRKATGAGGRNSGELLRRRHMDKALLLFSPISLNRGSSDLQTRSDAVTQLQGLSSPDFADNKYHFQRESATRV